MKGTHKVARSVVISSFAFASGGRLGESSDEDRNVKCECGCEAMLSPNDWGSEGAEYRRTERERRGKQGEGERDRERGSTAEVDGDSQDGDPAVKLTEQFVPDTGQTHAGQTLSFQSALCKSAVRYQCYHHRVSLLSGTTRDFF